jgi:3-oxoacyl-[acyl-carrier protein] reductase
VPDFKDQTAVVTGASRGLGRSLALALAKAGAFVYVGFHVQEAQARKTLEKITAAGGQGALLRLDVRRVEDVDSAAQKVSAERGGVDLLVNNAGVLRDSLFTDMEPKDFADVLSVNLTGVFLCCQAFSSLMMKRRRGAIVNVASVAGLRASPGQANYSASKGGLVAMGRTIAAELAPFGIRVNSVVPGLLTTGMAGRLDHRALEKKQESLPLRRLGTGEEVAAAVMFLLSDAAAYITGQALVVDGGLSL